MKRTLFFIACVLTSLTMSAQEYHPDSFLSGSKVWTLVYKPVVDPNLHSALRYIEEMKLVGDTVIDGIHFGQIYNRKWRNDETMPEEWRATDKYIGQDGGKVYQYFGSAKKMRLDMDFSLQVGDKFGCKFFLSPKDTVLTFVVTAASDTIMDSSTDKKPRKCIHIQSELYPELSDVWIEGIESLDYGLLGFTYYFHWVGSIPRMVKCTDGNAVLYQTGNQEANAYRPFVEDDKVWKVGAIGSGNPMQLVEYYYFDGDTIIDGKTCKQMMSQRYVTPGFAEANFISQNPPLCYVGAWYEADKKVYKYDTTDKQFKLMYDFSLDASATLMINNQSYVVGPRQTGGLKGFKGVYNDVWESGDGENNYRCAPWLEGVGGIYGPPTINVFNVELADPMWFLMSCTVGDEVIYLNDEYEDGATPESAGARKRFDFSHTGKDKPKAPMKRGAAQSLYGEYNDQQLGINLGPLDDAYQVRITDESGKTVYEKAINAGTIVGLNIDISAYARGRYTVIVENSDEMFTGEFDAQATGIGDVRWKKEDGRSMIYNLQGQRLHSLQKGLNIVNGQKVYVK